MTHFIFHCTFIHTQGGKGNDLDGEFWVIAEIARNLGIPPMGGAGVLPSYQSRGGGAIFLLKMAISGPRCYRWGGMKEREQYRATHTAQRICLQPSTTLEDTITTPITTPDLPLGIHHSRLPDGGPPPPVVIQGD